MQTLQKKAYFKPSITSLSILNNWLIFHSDNPSKAEKILLANKANLNYRQVKTWFETRRRKTNNKNTNRISLKNRLILRHAFKNIQRPSKEKLLKLSNTTGLDIKRIRKWFTRERISKSK